MWLKNNVKELLALIFAVALVIFTGVKIIPSEAFVGVAAAVVVYYFEEKSKEKLIQEITNLNQKLKEAQHG